MKTRFLFPLIMVCLFALSACSSIPGMSSSKSTPGTPSSSSPSSSGSSGSSGSSDDGRYYVGDEIATDFFKYTVTSAETADEYDGHTPADGCKLVVVAMDIKNTETYSMPMFASDFELQWGSGDEDYSYPVAMYCNGELMDEYEIPINGSVSTVSVYEAPADMKDFALWFLEIYDNESVGDSYFTYFTAE